MDDTPVNIVQNAQSDSDSPTSTHDQHPTTPSAFAQPIPQPTASNSHGQRHSSTGTGFSQSDDLMQHHHWPQPPTQLRPSAPGLDEPDNALVHQFSEQNLASDAAKANSHDCLTPHPIRQSPTDDTSGHLVREIQSNAEVSTSRRTSVTLRLFIEAPDRNPDKYGANVNKNQKKCFRLAADFFNDSVKRTRERNKRQSEVEKRILEPDISQERREQIWCAAGRKEGQYLRFLRTKDKPDNYRTVKVIGRGSFGEVKLVQKKADGQVFAMKSLVKTEMLQREQLAHVRSERDILAEAESPWVVKLFTTFQDASFLYMLMEFLPGGDLMTMLIKYEIFSEDITRFYMAECILAIEAVHELGFIHRDIKPDNILLDRHGHVKLTDFGLSTGFQRLHDNSYYQQLLQGKSKPSDRTSIAIDQINLTISNRSQINEWRRSRRLIAYSAVGTPDYIAPEIFTSAGYSFSCDWWSLGTIMFECLVGWPPFCAEDRHDTYRKIVNWRHTLYFPDDIQLGPQAEDLIRSLICNAENRLGRGGAHEIKAHPFFRGVSFDGLRRIRAPFEPRLASNIDTTYFPTNEIDQTGSVCLVKAQATQGTGPLEESLEMSLPFIGYTFKRFDNNFQ